MSDFLLEYLKAILPTAICFIGILLFFYQVVLIRRARRSMFWPQIMGKIIQSEIQFRSPKTNKKSIFKSYSANISYLYKIASRTYVGDKIHWGKRKNFRSMDKPSGLLLKYPKNKKILIYYNPRNPKDSVLEPGVNTTNLIYIVIALAMILGGWGYSNFNMVISTFDALW